jgi:hypothetical protein
MATDYSETCKMNDRRITRKPMSRIPEPPPMDDLGNLVPVERIGNVYAPDALVYVDALQKYPWEALHVNARHLKIRTWCHLFGVNRDTVIELALTIGLKLSWEQAPRDIAGMTIYHFDLTPSKRRQAVIAGAVEVDTMAGKLREWIKAK